MGVVVGVWRGGVGWGWGLLHTEDLCVMIAS